jgi:hypothetical protein
MRRYLSTCLMGITLLLLGLCIVSALLIRTPEIQIPPRHYPVPNAYDHYKRLGNAAYGVRRSDPKVQALLDRYRHPRLSLHSANEYAYLQRAFRPLLKEYRRYLNQPCVVVLEYDLNYSFSEVSGFRDMARVERLLMDYELRHGRTATALERFDSMARFSQQIRNEGGPVHFLVGIAISAIMIDGVTWELAKMDATALAQLVATCRRYEQERVPLVESMQTERYWGLSAIQRMREGALLADRDAFGSEPPILIRVPFVRKFVYPTALKGYDDYMKRVIAETQKPPWQRQSVTPPKSRWARPFVDMLATELEHIWHKEAREMAQMRLLGCAAAIRLHQLRTGRYPAKLEELNLGSMMIDPFTGQPFRYKTDPRRGFLLYSVGSDRQDDGGWRMPDNQTTRGDLSPIPYCPPRYATSPGKAVPLGEPAWLR